MIFPKPVEDVVSPIPLAVSSTMTCVTSHCVLRSYRTGKLRASALILPRHTSVIAGGDPENQLPPRRYFSFTLEVIDWMTIEAILKASSRSLM